MYTTIKIYDQNKLKRAMSVSSEYTGIARTLAEMFKRNHLAKLDNGNFPLILYHSNASLEDTVMGNAPTHHLGIENRQPIAGIYIYIYIQYLSLIHI